jgi:hypothetical protein
MSQDVDASVEAVPSKFCAVTPKCVVTVRADGLQLQGPVEAPPYYIGLPELQLLAEIDTGAHSAFGPAIDEVVERCGLDRDELRATVRRLNWSGRITLDLPDATRAVADHPTFGLGEPLDLDTSKRVALRVPLVLRLHDGRFEIIDHEGLRVAALTPPELDALATLIQPILPSEAFAQAVARRGNSIDAQQFARLLGQLDAADLITTADQLPAPDTEPAVIDRDVIIREVFDRHASAQAAAEAEREQRTGVHRPKVIPVAFDMGAPAGLGMVIAYAKAVDDGRLDEFYDFRTDWVWSDERLEEFTREPAIYLFSNYLWSHERCIAISQRVKELSPASITIHGGPDTPKYEGDACSYFAAHPHVDIAIRGEGEVSAAETLAALMPVIGQATPDVSVLADVPGITYRDGDCLVRNPDRDRIADVNTLPSPFVTGLFDVFTDIPELFVTVETNRGCPYSCTFCDWGSATASRVRQFDLERVFAELDWCSRTSTPSVSVADANFGMFKRDVEIAERVAELKDANGFPRAFGVSFAKNTVKHLLDIIHVLSAAGIMTQGVLSLQTMDKDTLSTIHRSNIKTERYDALAAEMRRARLPLMVELMMGLPGQSVATFADDLQQCINREIPARINHTTLLVNSPMNDSSYLAEHQIEVAEAPGPGQNSLVLSTSTFTRDDYKTMEQLRLGFMLYENYGVLRHVSRFVRQETGIREIDFYQGIRARTEERQGAWPALYVLVQLGSSMMTAPYSWALVMDDLRRYLGSELGVTDDSALESILSTQRALLPAHGRQFPEVVHLKHDVVAWHRAMLAAKGQGHQTDWPDVVARLAEFGPAEFVVDDPDHIVDTSLGMNRELNVVGVNWEFDSPLSRAQLEATVLVDWATDIMLPQRDVRVAPAVGNPATA